MRYAELKPDLAPSLFPSQPSIGIRGPKPVLSTGKASNHNSSITSPSTVQGDEKLYDDGVADEDMFEAGEPLYAA